MPTDVVLVHLGPKRVAPTLAIITSPQGAHDVLAGADGAFDKEMIVHVQTRTWAGDNLFNLPHEPWLDQRRALQPLFTKKHVAVYADRMAEIAQSMAAGWAASGAIDLGRETRRLTLRVLGHSLFGLDLSDHADDLGPPLTRSVQFITRRSLQPVRAPTWMPTPARHRFRTAMAVVTDAIDDAMAAARTDSGGDAELIRLFFELTDPATGEQFTDRTIRQELFAFLFAGHDTTATTLAYSLWALGHDHEVQDRVAAEAAEVGDRHLQASDLAQLPYTVQVIHEALRVCPPAATVARMAMRDVEVDGYRIPAGTNAVVGIYALHHDPVLWDHPERFDPDRFDRERSTISRWQYLPSVVAHAPVSAIISPYSKPLWPSPASFALSASNRFPTTSRLRRRSPWSPGAPCLHACARGPRRLSCRPSNSPPAFACHYRDFRTVANSSRERSDDHARSAAGTVPRAYQARASSENGPAAGSSDRQASRIPSCCTGDKDCRYWPAGPTAYVKGVQKSSKLL